MFYVVKITKEQTQNTQTIFRFENYKEALIHYTNDFAGALAYDTTEFVSSCIMDEYLNILEKTKWEKPLPPETMP